ncbi:hypothetical protein EJB05_35031, partial [Eragrostis curvula]
MEQWSMRCLNCGGEAKASSSMENNVLRPLLGLVMVLHNHGYRLGKMLMLVGFVFLHGESDEEGNDEFINDGLNHDKFIVLHVWKVRVGFGFPSSAMRIAMVDGEMAVFIQIEILVHGMSVWDGDPRWWNLWLFQ